MLTNIIDHRENEYAWQQVWGVVEPTCRDNGAWGADPAPSDARIQVENYGPAPLSDILAWAARFDGHITLYIYDSDPMEPAP